MDRRERLDDPVEAQRAALDGRQAEIWTALPGIFQSFDPEALTAAVQPAIRGEVPGETGAARAVDMPLLVDVPVVFPHGGGYSLTFPIRQGDECLVVFASRCMDAWWQSGGVQSPAEGRMHDLSDGFAIPGPWSQVTKIGSVSASAVQLRSDDGASCVEIEGQTVRAKSPEKIVLDAPLVEFTGRLAQIGERSFGPSSFKGGFSNTGGRIESNGISLEEHTHSGVQTGGGSTGGPQ